LFNPIPQSNNFLRQLIQGKGTRKASPPFFGHGKSTSEEVLMKKYKFINICFFIILVFFI